MESSNQAGYEKFAVQIIELYDESDSQCKSSQQLNDKLDGLKTEGEKLQSRLREIETEPRDLLEKAGVENSEEFIEKYDKNQVISAYEGNKQSAIDDINKLSSGRFDDVYRAIWKILRRENSKLILEVFDKRFNQQMITGKIRWRNWVK